MTQDKSTVFAFSTILNVEEYSANIVDFMSFQWTCTVSVQLMLI